MVHRFQTSTVSNGQTDGQTDRRRGAEPPTGADFTFCAHVIIRITNMFFKYNKFADFCPECHELIHIILHQVKYFHFSIFKKLTKTHF